MTLSVANLQAKHFLLTVTMSLVNLFVLGLLVPAIFSMPHFVKRQVPTGTTVSSVTTTDSSDTTVATEAIGDTTEALTTDELPTETTESSTGTEVPIETTQLATEGAPEATTAQIATEPVPIATTVPIDTTETIATDVTPTDTTESLPVIEEITDIIEILGIGNETVEGSTALIIIPIDISNLTDITELTPPTTITSVRKKRSASDEELLENRDSTTNSTESEEITTQSTEDYDDTTTEVTESDEVVNGTSTESQEPPSELLPPLTNTLPIAGEGVLRPISVGNPGFLIPLINRLPHKPQKPEVFLDQPTDDEYFYEGKDVNQETGFNAVNCDPHFTDKVNYENLHVSEDPDVYLFNRIFYNFFESLQNIIYELKAQKTIDSKGNINNLDINEENENSFGMRQPNHHPSTANDYFVSLKLMLGLMKETPGSIPSKNFGGREDVYNL